MTAPAASLPALAFPPADVPVRAGPDARPEVYDAVRRRWVVLTPEEWVRQHLVRFLAEHRGYALVRLALEVPVPYNGLARRADLVAYGRDGRPALLAECKAPSVRLTQAVTEQTARYNRGLGAPLWLVTNGRQHLVGQGAGDDVLYLPDVPGC